MARQTSNTYPASYYQAYRPVGSFTTDFIPPNIPGSRDLLVYYEDISPLASGSYPSVPRPYRSVLHEKLFCNYFPMVWAYHLNTTLFLRGGPYYENLDILAQCRAAALTAAGALVPDWDKHLVNHFGARNSSNLINNLLELDDIGHTFQSLGNVASNLVGHARRLLRDRRPALVSTSGVVLRAGVDTSLTNDLALLPLVGDTINYIDRFHNLDRNYRRTLQQRQAQQTVRGSQHRSFSITTIARRNGFVFEYSFDNDVLLCTNMVGSVPNRITTPLESAYANAMDTLGIYPDLGTLWNAVPFSFLVDYVVPIGSALEGVGPDLNTNRRGYSWSTPDFVVASAGYSIKVVQKFKVRLKEMDLSSTSLARPLNTYVSPGVVAEGTYTRYLRTPSTPIFDGVDVEVPEIPSLSGTQTRVSSALAASFALNSARTPRRSSRLRNH